MKIYAERVLTPSGWEYGKTIETENGFIQRISGGDCGEMRAHTVVPGFFDTHVHGGCGFDACSGNMDNAEKFLLTMAQEGVTDAVLTLSTASPEQIRKGTELIAAIMEKQAAGELPGTRIRGIHLEGPFINPARAGAMRKELMLPPSPETFDALTGTETALVKMVTVAPELPGSMELAEHLQSKGIVVQAGHTDATYDEGEAAFRNGFSSLCHTFNAARPIHHREPSVVTAALNDDSVYCEAICDLLHLHPGTVKLIHRCKGADRMVLVSDSTMPNGLPDGEYFATNHPVIVKGGVGRTPAGNLSGGTCFLGAAVQRLIVIGIPEKDVFTMASRTPARRLGFDDTGRIAAGCRDHLAVFDSAGDFLFSTANEMIYKKGE